MYGLFGWCRCRSGAEKLQSELPKLWPVDHGDGPDDAVKGIQICSAAADQKVPAKFLVLNYPTTNGLLGHKAVLSIDWPGQEFFVGAKANLLDVPPVHDDHVYRSTSELDLHQLDPSCGKLPSVGLLGMALSAVLNR